MSMSRWISILTLIVVTTLTLANQDIDEISKAKTFQKKMLARRREEHLALLKMIANNSKYEHRFQLILIGITKSFDLIDEHKSQLKNENPKKVTEAKMIITENACLIMDFIVNFDDIYMVLNKMAKSNKVNWRDSIRMSLDFLEENKELLDEITLKEFEFTRSNLPKIFDERKLPDYTLQNSIRNLLDITGKANKEEEEKLKVVKNKKKKFKKGPSLHEL